MARVHSQRDQSTWLTCFWITSMRRTQRSAVGERRTNWCSRTWERNLLPRLRQLRLRNYALCRIDGRLQKSLNLRLLRLRVGC